VSGYNVLVYYDGSAIANILSLKNLGKQYPITYDSTEMMFVVHQEAQGKPDMHFVMHPSGLHYWVPDTTATALVMTAETALVATVADNMKNYTKRQIQGAERSRALYARLAFPSMRDFRWAVQHQMIVDCPVTVADVDITHAIWGKSVPALKGKTTRKQPAAVVRNLIDIPKEFLSLHRNVVLTVDMFFVDKIPFFISLSDNICFTGTTHLQNKSGPSLALAFTEIFTIYQRRGFQIRMVYGDGDFEPMRAMIEGLPGNPKLDVTAASEHVATVERKIRVVKERSRALRHSLPYDRIPPIMTVHMVLFACRMLNFFPTSVGFGHGYTPQALLTGRALNYATDLRLAFGQYCQVHENSEPRNSQVARTQGAICLGPSGNSHGGYLFMNLATGLVIHRFSWDELPVTDDVIARVNLLGAGQSATLCFADRHGRPIGDIEIPGVEDDIVGNTFDDDFDDDDEATIKVPPTDIDDLDDTYDDTYEDEFLPDDAEFPHDNDEFPNDNNELPGVPDQIPGVPEEIPGVPEAIPGVPEEIPGVRRSARAKFQTKEAYIPSMTGSKYAVAVT
jgi:hypothetical protein